MDCSKWKLTSTGAESNRLRVLLDIGYEPLNVQDNVVWLRWRYDGVACAHTKQGSLADKGGGWSTICLDCGDVIKHEYP